MKEKIVTEPENYYFSSARNYADLDSALDIEVVFMGWDNPGFDRVVMFIVFQKIVIVTDCKSARSGINFQISLYET